MSGGRVIQPSHSTHWEAYQWEVCWKEQSCSQDECCTGMVDIQRFLGLALGYCTDFFGVPSFLLHANPVTESHWVVSQATLFTSCSSLVVSLFFYGNSRSGHFPLDTWVVWKTQYETFSLKYNIYSVYRKQTREEHLSLNTICLVWAYIREKTFVWTPVTGEHFAPRSDRSPLAPLRLQFIYQLFTAVEG